MDAGEIVVAVLGGGAVGVIVPAIEKAFSAYLARRRASAVESAEVERIRATERTHEQDITKRTLIRREGQHASCLERVEHLQGEMLKVTGKLATCESDHRHSKLEISRQQRMLNRLLEIAGIDPQIFDAAPSDGDPAE